MKVFLSPTANKQLLKVIEYLELSWSDNVLNNFIAKVDRAMQTISQIPKGFPESQKFPGLHKCVITSQTVAYYRINQDEKEVEIIAIFDTRRDLN